MPNLGVISFNSGKMTPLVDGRSDIEKYSSGCRELQNMIPRIYGPAERRPGTKKVALVEDASEKSRMIPFIFSSTIAYDLEFAEKVINVYFDGVFVASVTSPYLEEDLFQIQFKQSADVIWLVHPSYNPYKLSRTTTTTFSLDKISFENGPFIERNDILISDGVTMRAIGNSSIVATAGAAGVGTFAFTSNTDVSSLFPPNQRYYINGSTANDGAYTVNADTATDYTGTTLTVYANETIPDGTDDGQIFFDGETVTLSTSDDTFASGHVDALFKITHKRLVTVVSGTVTATGVIDQSIDVKGSWTFTTNGNWEGTIEIQRLADGTNWELVKSFTSVITAGQGSRNALKSDVEKDDGVQYRMNVTSYTSGSIIADFTVNNSTQDSIFKITSVTNATTARATTIIAPPDRLSNTRWAEGSWSNVRGWPRAITFFEERSIYGFTEDDARNVWLSKTNKFESFEAGTDANDSFALKIPTADTGRWLGSLEALTAGMSGEEYRIMSTNFSEALTPANASIKVQTKFGSTDIQAQEVNEALIFVDSVAKKVREYTWFDPKQKFVSPDLTALAEDITAGGITSMAVQKNPDNIVWFTIADSPYLISMTYEREQKVVAFAEHPLGGSGIAESISITPGTSEDVITITVRRTINGQTVRTIEQMQPRDWGDDTDIFFVDSGIIDTSGSTTITGLTHLNGETVQVMVDGALQTSKKVSGGEITIKTAGDRVVVGLPYEYKVSPMRPDVTSLGGTTLGSIMKTHEIVASFFKTLNAKYGNGDNQDDIDWRTTEPYGSPPDLFTGLKTLVFDGGFTDEQNVVISGSDPFPCTVRAIILRTKKTGR